MGEGHVGIPSRRLSDKLGRAKLEKLESLLAHWLCFVESKMLLYTLLILLVT